MKTITDLKAQVKNKKRVNIYLDNAYYCGLELETVIKNRLKIGQTVEEDAIKKMQSDSERLIATDKALNYISRTKKTKKQVETYLKGKGYLSELISEVIDKISSYGYLSDEEYAEDYIRVYKKTKGKRLLVLELKRKGVSDKDIENAIKTLDGENESAIFVAEKYLKNKPRDKATKLKCYKYLLSKGFDYDVSKSAVESIIKDEDDY